jgi:hypothetical protein
MIINAPIQIYVLILLTLVGWLIGCSSQPPFPSDSRFGYHDIVMAAADRTPLFNEPNLGAPIMGRLFKGMTCQINGISKKKTEYDNQAHYFYQIGTPDGRKDWWTYGGYLVPSEAEALTSPTVFFNKLKEISDTYFQKGQRAEKRNQLTEALEAYTEARIIYRFNYEAELGILRVRCLMKH